MMATFISQCEKNALKKTRRVLDAFANRIGDNTWQTVITQEVCLHRELSGYSPEKTETVEGKRIRLFSGRNKMLSHNHINSTDQYVALDVETTGLSPKNGDRVIEIGAVTIENQSIIAEFSSLIDVGKRIPWQVQQVHGITNEMLEGEPRPDDVLPEFYKFITGSILVAHNASFDIGFLRHEFALLGMSLNNRSLCTLKMSRKLYPHLPDHKLETVSRYLLGRSCKQMQRHRALDDARLAAMIWFEMEKI